MKGLKHLLLQIRETAGVSHIWSSHWRYTAVTLSLFCWQDSQGSCWCLIWNLFSLFHHNFLPEQLAQFQSENITAHYWAQTKHKVHEMLKFSIMFCPGSLIELEFKWLLCKYHYGRVGKHSVRKVLKTEINIMKQSWKEKKHFRRIYSKLDWELCCKWLQNFDQIYT